MSAYRNGHQLNAIFVGYVLECGTIGLGILSRVIQGVCQ